MPITNGKDDAVTDNATNKEIQPSNLVYARIVQRYSGCRAPNDLSFVSQHKAGYRSLACLPLKVEDNERIHLITIACSDQNLVTAIVYPLF